MDIASVILDNFAMRKYLGFVLTLALIAPMNLFLPNSALAAKAGAICKTNNARDKDGSISLVCKKNSSGKLVWSALSSGLSQTDFRNALKLMSVEIDEFEGNYEVFSEKSSKTLTIQGKTAFGLSLAFTKDSEDSAWTYYLTSNYLGQDWVNHDVINIKSSVSTLSFRDVMSINKNVLDYGSVAELGAYEMTKSEVLKFCALLKGNNVKFRLSGTGGKIIDVTGDMTKPAQTSLKAACVVFNGLLQGLTP